jgi:cellulose synthase/poly-beta-1,6-N-acetylglucosamine synthase-like glycosyltransferase
MQSINDTIAYVFLFLSLYFEVFLLITYFEIKEKKFNVLRRTSKATPKVSVIVPCWNEEATISKTIFSLLELNYSKDRLQIVVVDDGSTDNTWTVLQEFKDNKQITLLQKENGGKHSALNFALDKIDSEFVGCLDADSFVHPDSLNKILDRFEDERIMAVTPSMRIHNPSNIIEQIQKIEYTVGILIRNILAYLNAQYVTPGPFTIFRRKVFTDLGYYKKAHQTEDLEMALRMQSNRYKISNVADAYVYTTAPKTIKALYKQRLRWTHGFVMNIFDYRHMFFRPQYGNLGVMVLPLAGLSLVSSLYMFIQFIANSLIEIINKASEVSIIGINLSMPKFDLFYINTNVLPIAGFLAFLGWISIVYFAVRLTEGKFRMNMSIVYFMSLYVFLAPLWTMKAIYNATFARNTNWR